MILSFRTDLPGQTVQTQIRLEEQPDQGLQCLPFHLIICNYYSMVEQHSSHFRVITTNILGFRIFRKFTVDVFFIKNKKLNKKNEQTRVNNISTMFIMEN